MSDRGIEEVRELVVRETKPETIVHQDWNSPTDAALQLQISKKNINVQIALVLIPITVRTCFGELYQLLTFL